MPDAKRSRNSWVLGLIGACVVAVAMGLAAFGPSGSLLSRAIRGMALTGYQLVFLSIVSSAYMMDLVRFFGRPFIRTHHILSVAALVFITAHPILVAIQSASPRVFVPQFDSLRNFFALGGRPAWYLIAAAVAAALARQRIPKAWRAVHFLNYVAFALATVHANLSGANFESLGLRLVSWAMLLAILAVFARQRLKRKKPTQKRAAL